MMDELLLYCTLGRDYAGHQVVSHGKSGYVRCETVTNTVESFFSILKRAMKGIYQHCGKQHLHRYLAEFDFRYTNRIANGVDDAARTGQVIRGIGGRRLRYRRPSFAA